MKILFLDDMAVRHASFDGQLNAISDTAQLYAVDDWRCWNAEQAFKQIADRDFDVMFLDHDLADAHYSEHRTGELAEIPAREKSGTEVAEAIALLPDERKPKLVVVHSWNRYGANRTALILSNAGIQVLQVMFSDDLLKTVLPFFPK